MNNKLASLIPAARESKEEIKQEVTDTSIKKSDISNKNKPHSWLLFFYISASVLILLAAIFLHPLYYLSLVLYLILVVKYESHIKTTTALVNLGQSPKDIPAWWYFTSVIFWISLIAISFLYHWGLGFGVIVLSMLFHFYEKLGETKVTHTNIKKHDVT